MVVVGTMAVVEMVKVTIDYELYNILCTNKF